MPLLVPSGSGPSTHPKIDSRVGTAKGTPLPKVRRRMVPVENSPEDQPVLTNRLVQAMKKELVQDLKWYLNYKN